jgi:hypothetical protein
MVEVAGVEPASSVFCQRGYLLQKLKQGRPTEEMSRIDFNGERGQDLEGSNSPAFLHYLASTLARARLIDSAWRKRRRNPNSR